MKIDLNIGLAIGQQQNALSVAQVDQELAKQGLLPLSFRLAQSGTETTYVVRCQDQSGGKTLAPRIWNLAANLQQDCIAAVPLSKAPPFLAGPFAHKWGGCFLAAHWISLT